ncbi:hypothetical protein [Nitrospina watsonii]|uniref:Uncharacterized protein n=1 Tax=Nitrospina watsonii TaxID=1323948 RepID=A0ABM9HEG6_9BACT|nr:hypothetical protein [Nitrospina watsonii]CAI2718612.1 conserved exported protein of unknown function [Nitrospina watsonii]
MNSKKSSLYFKTFCLFAAMLLWLVPWAAPAQVSDSEGTFVEQGPVAFDTEYQLAESRSSIVFKIRNDGPRTISHLYAWIYRYEEGPNGPIDFRLVNNPHRSAILIEGGPHRSGKVAQWRFTLNDLELAQAGEKFTLKISPKSVFYAHLEPRVLPSTPE